MLYMHRYLHVSLHIHLYPYVHPSLSVSPSISNPVYLCLHLSISTVSTTSVSFCIYKSSTSIPTVHYHFSSVPLVFFFLTSSTLSSSQSPSVRQCPFMFYFSPVAPNPLVPRFLLLPSLLASCASLGAFSARSPPRCVLHRLTNVQDASASCNLPPAPLPGDLMSWCHEDVCCTL